MKIRRDAVALSSVIFTVALLMVAPTAWSNAMAGLERNPFDPFDPIDAGGLYKSLDSFAPEGFASLAIIAIGLMVAWTGYIRGVRWTWSVMFLIVWAWYFPLSMLPNLQGWPHIYMIGWLDIGTAIRESGMSRIYVKECLGFLLMLIALILPLPAFIWGRGSRSGEPGWPNSGAPKKPDL